MSKSTLYYPSLSVDTTGGGVVSQAGAITLLRTAEKTGLTARLSAALSPWRKPLATHDSGKIVLDLAVAVALGGDCLADVALLREEPGVFGSVASDPTVSRLFTTLAADAPTALRAINTARAAARQIAWAHAGARAPDHDISAKNPLIIDLDATLVTAHSEKEHAAPTYKKGFGHHPFCAFVDHGHAGTGEPLALALRPGNAGSNTATDHISIIAEALAQLPFPTAGRVGRKGVDPCRRGRWHPRGRGVPHEAGIVVLSRVRVDRQHGRQAQSHPAHRVDPGLRRRGVSSRRGVGC